MQIGALLTKKDTQVIVKAREPPVEHCCHIFLPVYLYTDFKDIYLKSSHLHTFYHIYIEIL